MKGIYKPILALLSALILLPFLLWLTMAHWLPTLAGIWLTPGTRLVMAAHPRLHHKSIVIPELRYLAGNCELARLKNARLSRSGRWLVHLDALNLNADCFSQIPVDETPGGAPRSLQQWQNLLPNTWLTIDKFSVAPWPQYSGSLRLSLTPRQQILRYNGALLDAAATLTGQTLTISELKTTSSGMPAPVALTGEMTLPSPPGWPTTGGIATRLKLAQVPQTLDVTVRWSDDEGAVTVSAPSVKAPLLSLPWVISPQRFEINGGQWNWPYSGLPLSGGVTMRFDNWQQGLENTVVSGRLNVLTHGQAGKGNAVLNIGPGKISMANTAMPLQLTGEAKRDALVFYGALPGQVSGALTDPQLLLQPGALLRSRGRVIDSLDIDEIRWPLAGVRVSRAGVDGRLQAILRAHDQARGEIELHLDGKAHHFLPDAGLWQWRYWGNGSFTPLQARWDVQGQGEWRDQTIALSALSGGFDKLEYGAMRISQPRLTLAKPLYWQRDTSHESLSGDFSLTTGATAFSAGSTLPPATLNVGITGKNPSSFQFKGDLRAKTIGPVRVNGRWDGARLRGNAWWPRQALTVFQPLIPPGWKMALKAGTLYAQVAFSAADGQGFEAGGHGVVNQGSAWLPDNQINGVDFVLPFRFQHSTWHFGTQGPVTLRIAEIRNQIAVQNITADLEGWYPWSEPQPLLLSNVSAGVLDGKVVLQQLRMPQHDAALLRLQNLSSSKLISAINPKQFTMSGRINGGLPLWFNHPRWLVKNGWVTNPGPLTFRMDKDMADVIVANNMAAGSAINWLRYMEISRSWANIDLDNLGVVRMNAAVTGISHVEGKSNTVNLRYNHQENLFTLWRSLRFGDNLQTWLEENAALPQARGDKPGKAREEAP